MRYGATMNIFAGEIVTTFVPMETTPWSPAAGPAARPVAAETPGHLKTTRKVRSIGAVS
jgi:hypothetical protein